MKVYILPAVFIALLGICSTYVILSRDSELFVPNPDLVVCDSDAKLCPDGSYVGRSGLQCEFAACPTPSVVTGTTAKGTIEGTMTIGPVCPVERADNPCKPTPEMFAARKINVYRSDKITFVITMTPDANGNFSTLLAVGNYYVTMADPSTSRVGGVSGLPATVTIKAGETVRLSIDIDTGIR